MNHAANAMIVHRYGDIGSHVANQMLPAPRITPMPESLFDDVMDTESQFDRIMSAYDEADEREERRRDRDDDRDARRRRRRRDDYGGCR